MSFTAVIDSGVGGLTVLKNLTQKNSKADFVYLADHAFCPYGTKTPALVKNRVIELCCCLKNVGANNIVLACNTASVFSSEIRSAVKLPIFDVIFPTCVDVKKTTQNKKVALLATNVTIKCGTYQRILNTMGINVISLPCNEFVCAVENRLDSELIVTNKLRCLSCEDFDTIVLGCTHFPYLQKQISRCFPQCKLVSCSNAISKYFCTVEGDGKVACYTTGNEKTATLAASQLGFVFERLEIY